MKIITADKIKFNDSTELSSATNSGLNYISNPGAEVDVSGAFTYADTAGTSPVDGTGGSPNITITRTTSSPLRGSASYLLTKDAANRQGEGFSIPFNIHSADKASMLQIGADIIVGSGTFNAGSNTTDSDVTFWVYDVTNSRLIQPTNYKISSNSSTLSFPFLGTFQTSPDSTSYRLIFHIGSTNASAWTLKIDNIVVGPLLKTVTSAVQTGIEYTPSSAISNTASNNFIYSRIGNLCRMSIGINYTGAGPSQFSHAEILPPGLSIDWSKLGNTDATVRSEVGTFMSLDAGVATYGGTVYVDSTVFNPLNFGFTPGNTDGITMLLEVPIAGWGSNVELNSMDSNRPIHAIYMSPQATNSSTTVPINYQTKILDTHNAVTTGGSWNFKAPMNGVYTVKGSFLNSTGIIPVGLYVQGSQVELGSHASAGNFYGNYNFEYPLKAGETLDVRLAVSDTIVASASFFIAISKLDSATQIGANETVAASYYCSANSTVNSLVQINYDTKLFDTHNAVTTGVGSWKWTAPVSGKYLVSGVGLVSTSSGYFKLYKGGALYNGYIGYVNSSGTCTLSGGIDLLAGEYIDIRFESTQTIYGQSLSNGPGNQILVKKI
jgi:hypothetical protein